MPFQLQRKSDEMDNIGLLVFMDKVLEQALTKYLLTSFKDLVVVGLPWVLSALTVWMTVLNGNKNKYTWVVGLGNQVLWTVWIVVSQTWGLVPLNLTLWVLYYRNHQKWTREAAAAAQKATGH